MRDPVFTGSCVASVTPFTHTGIDFDKLRELIERQIAAGTDAICICGTTGESSTQSRAEHLAAVRCCVEQAAHRVKVIAGAGSNCTSDAIFLSQSAEDAGADALLLVTPYYNKATQQGLIRHYEAIARHVTIPMILYNVPSRTGVSFTAETYHALSQVEPIQGVKEASGSLSLVTHTRALCGDDFFIWSGNDDQVVPMMSMGAKGVVSVAANLIPAEMHRMAQLCLEGDFEAAARRQVAYTPFFDALSCEVNPIPIKTAMNLAGYQVGGLRLPMCEMTPEHTHQLRQALSGLGIPLSQ